MACAKCSQWCTRQPSRQRATRSITGLTTQTFKQRYNAHKHSTRDSQYRNRTSLSKHVWGLIDQPLKDQPIGYNIRWSMLRKATDYQNTIKRCDLYLAEKLEIIKATKERSLNRRSKLISQCRHENKLRVRVWCTAVLPFKKSPRTPGADTM